MSALYDVDNVSLDLAGPAAGLQRLLPGTAPRLTILSNLSLSIGKGEMLGLVGDFMHDIFGAIAALGHTA